MEMIGGSSAPYLARTPCVPLFCTSFNRVGNKERFRLPGGGGGGSFPLYGGTFARSYSVSNLGLFRHFFDTPGRQAREHLLEDFLGISGPEGLGTPVWRLQSQRLLLLAAALHLGVFLWKEEIRHPTSSVVLESP